MPDLKPCPFCGSEPTIEDIEPHEHHLRLNGVKLPDYPGSTVIECGCGCGLIDESRETVIERWNTRADSAAVAAEREACAHHLEARAALYTKDGTVGSTIASCAAFLRASGAKEAAQC